MKKQYNKYQNSNIYLGVWLDDKMKFSTHITKIASKISSGIGIISKARNYLTTKHKTMLFNTLVLPHFNYCSNTWATTNKKYTNILEKLQRKAAKVILDKPKRTPTRDIYKQLKWLPVEDRWKINRCTAVNKCLNNQVPEYLQGHFQLTKDTHTYRTRTADNNKVKIPKYRTVTGQRSFKYQGAIDYNSLPSSLYSDTSHKTFKNNIKTHLLNTQ